MKPPTALSDHHDLSRFDSGVPALDDWLKRRARPNQAAGASRTYVLCDGEAVVGYYALASGAVALPQAPSRLRRNMPDPIPVALLGRLALAQAHQGQGLGRLLLRDAFQRILAAADIIGIRGVMVRAISPEAHAFYLAAGLQPSPIDSMTLMATIDDLRLASGDAGQVR